MNIAGHYILASQIIGIGTLDEEVPEHRDENDLFNKRRLAFDVHLAHRSIKIHSRWFHTGDGRTNFERSEVKEYEIYTKIYNSIYNSIMQLLGGKTKPAVIRSTKTKPVTKKTAKKK